jgi:hypothetical protein
MRKRARDEIKMLTISSLFLSLSLSLCLSLLGQDAIAVAVNKMRTQRGRYELSVYVSHRTLHEMVELSACKHDGVLHTLGACLASVFLLIREYVHNMCLSKATNNACAMRSCRRIRMLNASIMKEKYLLQFFQQGFPRIRRM